MNIEKVGQNIDEIRKERGWSKSELAHRMGMNSEPGVFKHIATGGMSVRYLAKYAEVLGCTIADITEGVTDPKDFHLDTDITAYYPYNLAVAVGGLDSDLNRDPESKVKAMDILHSIYIPGMMKSLTDLTDREQKILYMRFNNHMTLEQIGKEFNICRDRVRQIEAKALRKLRGPKHWKNWKLDTMGKFFEAKEEVSRLELENLTLKRKLDEAFQALGIEHEEEFKQEEKLHIPLEDLELSVRSYNCLRRSGVESLADLENMTLSQFEKIRNLGRKCLTEIIDKMQDYGVKPKEEDK